MTLLVSPEKCPICGLMSKLNRHGCCNQCIKAIIYDNYERREFMELDDDFWGSYSEDL